MMGKICDSRRERTAHEICAIFIAIPLLSQDTCQIAAFPMESTTLKPTLQQLAANSALVVKLFWR